MTPTPSISQDTRLLAMICGTRGRTARRDNLLSAAGRFFLSHEEASKVIDDMIVVVRAEWENSLRRAGVSSNDYAAVMSAQLYDGFFLPLI